MIRIAIPSMLVLSLTLAACGGGGGGTEASDPTATMPQAQGTTTSSTLESETATASSAGANPAAPNLGAATPSAPAAANGALTTIDQVIADTSASSEAMVIDPRYDWQYKPAVTMYSPAGALIPSWWTGNRPTWSYNVLTWFTAYEAQGNAATNSRIQIKNLRFYVLSESTRTWKHFDVKAAPAVDLWKYPFTPAGGSSGVKYESSGGISIKPKYPNFHHGYGNSVKIVPQDVRAVFVAMEFRLAVDDASKPDDRSRAKYVVDTGGDYWPGNGQGDWSLGYAPGMGNSRMLLATPNWRTSSMLVPNKAYGATLEEIRKNPPPLN